MRTALDETTDWHPGTPAGPAQPEELQVPVAGGQLAVLRWPADPARAGVGTAPVVLAAHGITSNALAWSLVAEQLGGAVTLLAPDLRGRAGSRRVRGPYGIGAHADDLVRVLDVLGVERAVLAGHSMGAFAAAVAAGRAPERVDHVVLVDGGLPLAVPRWLNPDLLLYGALDPGMQQLGSTFRSRAAYQSYWRRHPAMRRDWSSHLAAHLDRDLIGSVLTLRSSVVQRAVRADAAAVLRDEETLTAVRRLTCPSTLLWAPRGMRDEAGGLYTARGLARACLDPDWVRVVEVEDVNHYTVLLGARGAGAVARELLRAAGSG
ncbi:MAG: alpha/beta hydrolase [Actinomycetota bacterium]|nr:alpha/beta hydrolase [Actinomycetota bacterium]